MQYGFMIDYVCFQSMQQIHLLYTVYIFSFLGYPKSELKTKAEYFLMQV